MIERRADDVCQESTARSEVSRRRALRMLAGGAVGVAAGSAIAADVAAEMVSHGASAGRPQTPDAALRRLMAGNERFVGGSTSGLRRSLERVRETAAGQNPYAAILGCADSRVPPELVFDEGVGDLFVVRVAGNIATPEEIASLEFGVAVLGAQVVLVLGHSACGAVKAAVDGGAVPGQISTLYQHIQPAAKEAGGDVERAVALNAEQQRDVLRNGSTVLREAIAAGKVSVEAGVYDLASGRVQLIGR